MLHLLVLTCIVGLVTCRQIPYFEGNLNYSNNGWEGFIVGGQYASSGQFPHVVSIRNTTNVHFCGGSVVTNRWVMSAAHCTLNRSPESTWIVVGALQLSTGGTNVYTVRIVNHPDFYPLDEAGDISLLQTRDSIVFSATVSPINLGSNHIGPGVVTTVAGWGRTGHSDPFPDTLKWINKNTISNAECIVRMPGTSGDIVQGNTLCTVNGPGEGMCGGDSGGALFIGNTAIGIVSWGIAPCGQGYPDAFARVSTHYNWLLTHINS
ncbi:hypothetical protein DMENIID0001_047410 [Sergentomyia squamirostris]